MLKWLESNRTLAIHKLIVSAISIVSNLSDFKQLSLHLELLSKTQHNCKNTAKETWEKLHLLSLSSRKMADYYTVTSQEVEFFRVN